MLILIVIVAVITCVAVGKVAYQKGFNEGMAYRRMMDAVSWREAIDVMREDD